MKVVLIKDVARLGRKGEVKEVPAGHATNFLIPRGFAIAATPDSLKRIEEEVKKHGEIKDRTLQTFMGALRRLEQEVVVLEAEANEKGGLFKGVHEADIVTRLTELNIPITEAQITLTQPIKELGTHEVTVSHGGNEGVLKLEIIKK